MFSIVIVLLLVYVMQAAASPIYPFLDSHLNFLLARFKKVLLSLNDQQLITFVEIFEFWYCNIFVVI